VIKNEKFTKDVGSQANPQVSEPKITNSLILRKF